MADISELNEQKRKVDFNSYDMSVKELISMVNDGIIDIAPEYQRQFRWDEERQSILDAHVDACLFNYDISDNLNLELVPVASARPNMKAGVDLGLRFTF